MISSRCARSATTHIPYRIAALTGFMSYTIGHNLGATVFTGGVVRFRIYRSWGLTLIDVAKVAFVTGLTFWLGNAVRARHRHRLRARGRGSINQLPSWVNRAIALTALAAIAAYLIWLLPRPRVIGRDGWTLTLPSARSTLLQIGIGIADLGLAAFAMVTLISVHASVDVAQVVIAFVFSALLGFISHAPGSLGVFDAAMLIALPQVEKEQLLAALVIFRGLYFVDSVLYRDTSVRPAGTAGFGQIVEPFNAMAIARRGRGGTHPGLEG